MKSLTKLRKSILKHNQSTADILKDNQSSQMNFSHPSDSFQVKETNKVVINYDANTNQKQINQYIILKEIGRGVHGKVKLCCDIETQRFYALKILDKLESKKRLSYNSYMNYSKLKNQNIHLNKIRREIDILKQCHHPNIIQLLEVIDDPSCRKIYLVLEYAENGDLKWKDEENQPILTLEQVHAVFKDLVHGIEYLHSHGIIHRDIKPANMLVASDGSIKISDFSVSFRRKAKQTSISSIQEEVRIHQEQQSTSGNTISLTQPSLSPAFSSNLSNVPPQTVTEEPDSLIIQADHPSSTTLEKQPSFSSSVYDSHSNDDQSVRINQLSLEFTPSSEDKPSSSRQEDHLDHEEEIELAKTVGSPAFFAPELCITGEELEKILKSKAKPYGFLRKLLLKKRPFPQHSHPLSRRSSIITKSIDIWAMGVTLYCLVFGQPPFMADTEFELFNVIPRQDLVFSKERPIPSSLKNLIQRMLEKDFRKRITLAEIKQHPWFKHSLSFHPPKLASIKRWSLQVTKI